MQRRKIHVYREELSRAAKITPKRHGASTTLAIALLIVNSGVYT